MRTEGRCSSADLRYEYTHQLVRVSDMRFHHRHDEKVVVTYFVMGKPWRYAKS